MLLVLLRGGDRTLTGGCPTREPADIGVGTRLGNGIADAGAVSFATDFGCVPCRLWISSRQKHLRAKCLEQSLDALIGERIHETCHTLRRDNRDALRLTGDGEEAFIAGRIITADRGEILVLIA